MLGWEFTAESVSERARHESQSYGQREDGPEDWKALGINLLVDERN